MYPSAYIQIHVPIIHNTKWSNCSILKVKLYIDYSLGGSGKGIQCVGFNGDIEIEDTSAHL